MKITIIIITLFILTSCAGMASKMANLGVVSIKKSTYNDETIVNVTPQWLYDPNKPFGNDIKLGANWHSKNPNKIILLLKSPSYVNIKSIDIRINKKTHAYNATTTSILSHSAYNTVSKSIYSESKNSISVPYNIVIQMIKSPTRLRIHTNKGYEDSNFSIENMPGGQLTAVLSIREFVEKTKIYK